MTDKADSALPSQPAGEREPKINIHCDIFQALLALVAINEKGIDPFDVLHEAQYCVEEVLAGRMDFDTVSPGDEPRIPAARSSSQNAAEEPAGERSIEQLQEMFCQLSQMHGYLYAHGTKYSKEYAAQALNITEFFKELILERALPLARSSSPEGEPQKESRVGLCHIHDTSGPHEFRTTCVNWWPIDVDVASLQQALAASLADYVLLKAELADAKAEIKDLKRPQGMSWKQATGADDDERID